MPTYEPKFTITPLQNVRAGTPVIFQQKAAFAGVNPDAGVVTLAVHDAQQGKFVYRYFNGIQPNVIMPTGEIIVRPNMYALTESVNIRPPSANLFIADEPAIAVHIPSNDEVRLLGLDSGSLVCPGGTQFDAFTSWEVGVMSLGEFVLLLKI
jgi:hypothetical protein